MTFEPIQISVNDLAIDLPGFIASASQNESDGVWQYIAAIQKAPSLLSAFPALLANDSLRFCRLFTEVPVTSLHQRSQTQVCITIGNLPENYVIPSRPGELQVFVVRHPLGFDKALFVILGWVPWTIPDRVCSIQQLIMNRSKPGKREEALARNIAGMHVICALDSVDSPTPISIRKVFAFVLHWHMLSSTSLFEKNLEKRVTAQKNCLRARWFRYFPSRPPRDELFGNAVGFRVMLQTVALLSNPRIVEFVRSKLCLAFQTLIENEKSAALFATSICNRFLVPLANATPLETETDVIFGRDCESSTPVLASATTLAEVDELSDTEKDYLAAIYVGLSDQDDCQKIFKNLTCFAFDILSSVGMEMWTNVCCSMPYSFILKAGFIYTCDPSAIALMACALFNYIFAACTSGMLNDSPTDWENRFEKALPDRSGVFVKGERNTEFDDAAYGGILTPKIVKLIPTRQFDAFRQGRAATDVFPDLFDSAEAFQLYNDKAKVEERSSLLADKTAVQLAALNVTRRLPPVALDPNNRPATKAMWEDVVFSEKRSAWQYNLLSTASRAADSWRHGTPVDIEDVVGNVAKNKALPACVFEMYQRNGKASLGNEDRKLYYRFLYSLGLPELDNAQIIVEMLRSSLSEKIAEQFKDIRGFENSLVKRQHELNAKLSQSYGYENSIDMTMEEALERTTPAKGCSSMASCQQCPFSWDVRKVNELFHLLLDMGVDRERAHLISDAITLFDANGKRERSAVSLCKLSLHALHTPSQRSATPPELNIYPRQARDFTSAAALHILIEREK